MKSKEELLQLINQAILSNGSKYEQWFISFSGHVNKIRIDYYLAGWSITEETGSEPERVDINLDKEGSIQEGYWFIKNRLR